MANKYRAWADGEVLTSANLIDFIQKNVVIPCDSSSDYPDSSTRREGMTVWDKNLDRLLVYTTTTTGWVPPWNLAWGRVAGASSTAATSSIGASTGDINNLSVTWTAVANRNYLTTVFVPIYQQGGGDGLVVLSIADGSNAERIQTQRNVVAGNATGLFLRSVETVTAGSNTRKARISVTASSGTIAYAANYPATILVEDIGPSAAPA